MAKTTRPGASGGVAAGNRAPSERILDAALERAEAIGWDKLRMHDVAEQLGISLADVVEHYRDLDGVADAWFAQAWRAMLAPPPPGFGDWPAQARLHDRMMLWFDALAEHRHVTGEMLRGKLYPSHPHHWVPMIFNLSRTIQWLREAALLDAGGLRRQVEEVGLTALFLATLAVWLHDESGGQERTRERLRRRLARGDRLMVRLWGAAGPGDRQDHAAGPGHRRTGGPARARRLRRPAAHP
jgi:AcrR family transcriptional regulator